jgi:hypothetical protein
MVVSSELRTHKVMEAAIRELMGAGTPPRFKFQDTYASIEFPDGYTVPAQATLEAKYNELLALEEDIQKTAIEGDLEVGTSNLYVDTETGRVGIGTTDPAYKLDVRGGVYIDNDSLLMSGYDEGPTNNTEYSQYVGKRYSGRILAGMEIENVRTNSTGTAITTDGQYGQKLHFRAHDFGIYGGGVNDRVMSIVGNNVGIGTTNPSSKLDVNGYIKNKNPVFHAYRSSAWTTTNYATVPFNVEVYDSTNSYNTNGTFTAPVAGYYFFSVFALTNGAVVMHLEFHKNGALTNGAEPYSGNVGSYACVSGSVVIYLNVNDYVEVVLVSGAIYGGGNHHNGFCGYLIG